jgi:hypothetical protein
MGTNPATISHAIRFKGIGNRMGAGNPLGGVCAFSSFRRSRLVSIRHPIGKT